MQLQVSGWAALNIMPKVDRVCLQRERTPPACAGFIKARYLLLPKSAQLCQQLFL